jgi:tRNA nucleotidyltransferase (CCA-adding enzyme)
MIRATRYKTRLGWELDPKTQTRYENAKGEDLIQYLSDQARSRELEQIGHEDDGLKVLQALEAEGWMKVLYAQWTAAKADDVRLKALHELLVELLMQGVHADISAAQMQLLTAKMAPKDLAGLKKIMLRPGFVEEWNSLDSHAAGFAKVLMSKENQTPSTSFKLFTSYDPEAVLWLGFTTKDAAIKERYNNFLKVWPEMRQRIPYSLMQEMRIRPELANYNEILHAIFLELIDGKLTTPEEMRAFLEPHSPPAPPPQITIKRTRGKRGAEPKAKDFDDDEEGEDAIEGDDDLDDMGGGDDDDIGLGVPKIDISLDVDDGDSDLDDDDDEAGEPAASGDSDDDEDAEHEPAPVKRGKGAKASKAAPEPAAPAKAVKTQPTPKPYAPPVAEAKAAAKPAPVAKPAPAKAAPPAKAEPAKAAPAKAAHVKAAPVKTVPAKPAPHAQAPAKKAAPPAKAPIKKAALKPSAKPVHKSVPKSAKKAPPAKAAPKAAAKPKPHKPAKPAPKKPVAKTAKKR